MSNRIEKVARSAPGPLGQNVRGSNTSNRVAGSRIDGATTGDGRTSPLGDGKGATTAKGPATTGAYERNRNGQQTPEPAPQSFWDNPGNRPQADPSVTSRDFPATANRPQTAGSPAQRVNVDSVPTGGTLPPNPSTRQSSVGTGSVGNTRVPFKGMH